MATVFYPYEWLASVVDIVHCVWLRKDVGRLLGEAGSEALDMLLVLRQLPLHALALPFLSRGLAGFPLGDLVGCLSSQGEIDVVHDRLHRLQLMLDIYGFVHFKIMHNFEGVGHSLGRRLGRRWKI
ncbi:hypothetical protein DYB25_005509 [Aphanomyces astaci]|uniref:Uncharacterized protein n=1 Tax=Aphanomyces astaci TaxID=112090 RepID=A0A396ZRA4_APHAT|nr:hypothetical protein DYB25_005509 [Aphanomyces astaci]